MHFENYYHGWTFVVTNEPNESTFKRNTPSRARVGISSAQLGLSPRAATPVFKQSCLLLMLSAFIQHH
jgi:hypothetical protein